MTRPRINVAIRGEETAGELSVMDNRVRADAAGPPLHHHDFDEAFYIVEGELVFQLEDRIVTRRAGEMAFAPRGVPHTYANQSGAEARFVLVCTPAGFERYFDKLAAEMAGVEPPPQVALGWPEVTKVGPQIGDRPPDDAGAPGAKQLPPPPATFTTRVLLRSEASDGIVSVVENTVPAHWEGTPLHHHAFDEAFHVLDGELTLQVGDRVVTRGPGESAFAPRDVHHAVANHGAVPARYVLVCTPAGFERYFDEIAARMAAVDPPPEAAKGYPETIVVGPPIARR
jgi:mannose-6-phosphate isomerase-like protein (cupin superfamily)